MSAEQSGKAGELQPFENLEQLARRAVACKRWRWMPGMLTENGVRVTSVDDDGYTCGYAVECGYLCIVERGTFPDLSDPATLGCLLALVREAHCDQQMFVETYSFLRNNWRCTGVSFSMQWDAPTEAAALVAALEAAP